MVNIAKKDRIEIFCRAIIEDKTQYEAYLLAYPNAKKWKRNTVDKAASVFAKSEEVQKRLAELRKEAEIKTAITFEKVLNEIASVAFSDIGDYIEIVQGAVIFKDSNKKNKMGCINEVKQGKAGMSIRMHDKLKALEMICKLMGYDKQDNSQQEEEIDGLSQALINFAKELKSDE